MTVGAAGGLNVILKALLNPCDEVITFAPFFGEYRGYTANHQGVLVVISPNTVDFQPNLKEFEECKIRRDREFKELFEIKQEQSLAVVQKQNFILKLFLKLKNKFQGYKNC